MVTFPVISLSWATRSAAEIGMLSSAPIVEAVAEGLRAHRVERLVVDPVCASKHGDPLLSEDALTVSHAMRRELNNLTPVDAMSELLGLMQRHDSNEELIARALSKL